MKPTQEQVIAWAQEAFKVEFIVESDKPRLERFAALAYEAGRKDENEACAKVCGDWNDAVGVHLAAAIRARREQ